MASERQLPGVQARLVPPPPDRQFTSGHANEDRQEQITIGDKWLIDKPTMVLLGQPTDYSEDHSSALLVPTGIIDAQRRPLLLVALFNPQLGIPQIKMVSIGSEKTPTAIGRLSDDFGSNTSGLIADPSVSRYHATLSYDEHGIWIRPVSASGSPTAVLPGNVEQIIPGRESASATDYPRPLWLYGYPMAENTIFAAGADAVALSATRTPDGLYPLTIDSHEGKGSRRKKRIYAGAVRENTFYFINAMTDQDQTGVGENFINLSNSAPVPYTAGGFFISHFNNKPCLFVMKIAAHGDFSVFVPSRK
ncbi:MAG: FHA domain-containing protein, partial [Patescibacteria group bacterium]|nr:FHA domain-containing protein [Patescibacteria group bacterium]